ncbi:MAG: hypothetical protein JRI70_06980 [Deltaproteobacteria bacterium]|nr:hypothetical protein [Deltaproteobacteria bacterium]
MDYTRPDPVMDYVSQEMGMYDTVYEELKESDCRGCHTGTLFDEHHPTDPTSVDECTRCHACGEPPDCVVRNCLTDGCHSFNDVSTNGWHHYTERSDSGNCGACHDLVPVEEFGPGVRFEDDPPTVSPPTPYSCENCHWCQEASTTGHPSTHDHYDDWGNLVGFSEYGKPACSPYDTHHMGFHGNIVNNKCYMCHGFGFDWENPDVDWNPDNRERIRHCERCHTPDTLHSIHDRDCYGWEAVGFHVDEPEDERTEPDTYRFFGDVEMCSGCHTSILMLAPVANPNILWPANHEMIDIIIETNAQDVLGSAVTLTATVTSNEATEGLGGGDMTPDWTEPVIDQEQGIITLKLRAERYRHADGRVYTISITATDSTGWARTEDVQVTAPRKNPKL